MKTNMADSTWKEDDNLKKAMTKLVQQGLQRIEALDFLKRDFPQYPWSIRTLDSRLRHFDIFYNDKGVEVEDVKTAVGNELKDPGKLWGYRAMHRKLRQEYGINATRDQVYNVPALSFLPAPYRGWTWAGERRVQDNLHAHVQKADIFPQKSGEKPYLEVLSRFGL